MNKEELKKLTTKMWIADNGDGTYQNPILYTDYSDPDVIRVGEDYYMIASSFCNTPSVPVLHSKDLINWKVINYAMEKLPFDHYEKPMHGCGAWAPSIRYHKGFFYVFVPMPDEGIFMCRTSDPFEKWDQPVCVRHVTGWIDPCPFWDEDGQAYMVSAFARSRIGFKSILHLCRIKPDGTGVLEDGKHIYDGNDTQPTIEGPKLYKRNGYYYIFAPAGGVKSGWQTVLRSKSIWGPYEERIVLHQGNTQINGPHQGAWVDTPTGENWFIHFQDVGNAGRIIHLQPMDWVEDWPVIGVHADENGCGEPVQTYQKPTVGKNYPIDAPEDSDFFESDTLGLQWQWNANYKKHWYSLNNKKGQLLLYSQPVKKRIQMCDVGNLLLQKWPAPEFQITTMLYLDGLKEKDVAGMISLGGLYTALCIAVRDGKKFLIQRTGEWTKENEVETFLEEVFQDRIYFRMLVRKSEKVSFQYSKDGEQYLDVGQSIEVTPGRWVGVKAGLFAIQEAEFNGGKLAVDYFIYQNIEE